MQVRAREVAIRHLQPVVQRPERRAKTVADAREATARSRVRFKHQEGLPGRLCDRCGVEVGRDEALAGGMVEVAREHGLGVDRGAEACVGILCGAVVVRVAGWYE